MAPDTQIACACRGRFRPNSAFGPAIPPDPTEYQKVPPVRGFRSQSHTSYHAVTRNHTPHGPNMAPKRGKEQPPDRSPTSPPEPSCRSSSIALRDSVADARTAKMSDRIPFRKSTTDRRGGQPWPGRAWTCWSRCATRRPGVTSTSCAKRSRYSAEAGKVRAKPQLQLLRGRAAEIMGRPLVEDPRGLRVSERRGFVRATTGHGCGAAGRRGGTR